MKALHVYIVLFLCFLAVSVQPLPLTNYQKIDNFMVKENLTANGKIAIIAVDSADIAQDHINGTFKFSINGFEQALTFHNGVAVASHPISESTFVFFKHKNHDKTIGKLYFLYKKDNKITPFKINGLLLIIIPTIILLIAYTFKRLLSTFLILALIYGYFSFNKGLSISQILESAFHVLKNLL